MKKFFKYFAAVIVILLISTGALYFLFPGIIFNAAIRLQTLRNGIVEKSITAGKHTWIYYEAGEKNKDVILLIHGYGASKFRWLNTIIYFKNEFHVIAPDLPGFGKSKINDILDYGIESYVKYLDDFIKAKQLIKIHLVGTSLGGYIAGYYATVYPSRLKSLTLLDTAGINSPILTDYQKYYSKTGKNLLDYRSIKEYNKAMSLVFFKPPDFPTPIKKYFVDEKKKNLAVEKKIFDAIIKNRANILGDRLNLIHIRTLAIWGEKDNIIHSSTAQIIKQKLKNSEIHILKDVGHMSNLEAPEKTHKIMQSFFKM